KDLLLILWGDADSGVSDRNLRESILGHGTDVDAPTFRRELDRIRQQVQDDLPDLAFVRLNLAKPGVDVCVKSDRPSPRTFTHQHQGILDSRRKIEVC